MLFVRKYLSKYPAGIKPPPMGIGEEMIIPEWISGIKYDGKLCAYRPHLLSDLLTFQSKKMAKSFCKRNSFPQNTISKVCSNLSYAYGIQDAHGNFLAFDREWLVVNSRWDK